MSILSDIWIREQALSTGMIDPFVEGQRLGRPAKFLPQLFGRLPKHGLIIKLAAIDASLLKITQVLGECW